MILRGRVQNGVVILENGASLPDGTAVEVRPAPAAEETRAPVPVSLEQREALLSLIGIWKTDHPPSDEEVKRIIEEGQKVVGNAAARAGVRRYLATFAILPIDKQTLLDADALPGNDFEDNILIAAAVTG